MSGSPRGCAGSSPYWQFNERSATRVCFSDSGRCRVACWEKQRALRVKISAVACCFSWTKVLIGCKNMTFAFSSASLFLNCSDHLAPLVGSNKVLTFFCCTRREFFFSRQNTTWVFLSLIAVILLYICTVYSLILKKNMLVYFAFKIGWLKRSYLNYWWTCCCVAVV